MSKISVSRLTYTHCPACESEAIAPLFEAQDYTVSQESFPIWECAYCQLRFTQAVPEENEIGQYYQSEEYISHSNTSKGLINFFYQKARAFTLQQKRRRVEGLSGKQQGRLLDLGCGTGEFLATMKKAGWETLGLEPDQGARKFARSEYGLEVSDSEQLFSLEPGSFDVISMWHVLEHVHRLHPYLDQLAKLLHTDGVLLIAVPNYDSLDAETYGPAWAAYDVPRHLYHFHPTSMPRLMEAHGLELVDRKAMPLDAFYVSLLSEKYIHGRIRLVQGAWQGLRSYLRAFGAVQHCSSVLYVVRKK